jgi:hypothetical protein
MAQFELRGSQKLKAQTKKQSNLNLASVIFEINMLLVSKPARCGCKKGM